MSDSNGISIHSPANGLTEGFGVGGGSKPPAPSVHPDVNMTGKSSEGKASGHEFGSIPAPGERSSVAADEVQFVTGVPTSGEATSLGPDMAGGLGTPPRV
jgi:hypothetical protein